MKRIAAISGALAVAAGAFGAHGLAGQVPPERLDTWKTAVLYHVIHAIVLLMLVNRPSPSRLSLALLSVGTVLFSGSLYALVLLDLPILGAITPLGGLCLIAGWLSMTAGIDAPASR